MQGKKQNSCSSKPGLCSQSSTASPLASSMPEYTLSVEALQGDHQTQTKKYFSSLLPSDIALLAIRLRDWKEVNALNGVRSVRQS